MQRAAACAPPLCTSRGTALGDPMLFWGSMRVLFKKRVNPFPFTRADERSSVKQSSASNRYTSINVNPSASPMLLQVIAGTEVRSKGLRMEWFGGQQRPTLLFKGSKWGGSQSTPD